MVADIWGHGRNGLSLRLLKRRLRGALAERSMTSESLSCSYLRLRPALWWYLASVLVLVCGGFLAAYHFPGYFDWQYTVASALASQKHNPVGSAWFAGALVISMALLWGYVAGLERTSGAAMTALRIGLVSAAVLGLERLLMHHLSDWAYKAHEILAILTFLGLYYGVLGLLMQARKRSPLFAFLALLVIVPLIAIGLTQAWLYFDQRDLGWVDTSWREMGVSLWLSFAFWQWLAIGFLWLGLGFLALEYEQREPADVRA
jgi:hypothetical protein